MIWHLFAVATLLLTLGSGDALTVSNIVLAQGDAITRVRGINHNDSMVLNANAQVGIANVPDLPDVRSSRIWRVASQVITFVGLAKIVLSLVVFTLSLIVKSSTDSERWAKVVATSLSVLVLFWITNSLSVDLGRNTQALLLAPAAGTPTGKLLAGAVAAACTWAFFWFLEKLARAVEDNRYIQTCLVFVSSGVVAVIVPVFLAIYAIQDLNQYRVFDVVLGVVIGGLVWIVHRLLSTSTA